MRVVLGLIALTAALAACIVVCVTALYAAGALAAAQTVRAMPFIGPHVSDRIQAWVLGAEEPLVAEVGPTLPPGTPLAVTTTPAPVTPRPGDPRCGIPYVFPVEGPITSGFGWRTNPFDPSRREFHAGIDFSVATGTAVRTTICGEVTEAGWSDLYGWVVSVANGNITTLYGHNSQLFVSAGDWVAQGQTVAASGSTGRSTAPHVHYGVSVDGAWVDPVEVFGLG